MAKFEGKTKQFFIARDLDYPESKPGSLVAIYHEDMETGKPVLEGWRGPDMESEEFFRKRLDPSACQNLLVDIGGYWECFEGTVIY